MTDEQRELRAIDVECPDCFVGPGEPCLRKSSMHNPDYRPTEIKTLHPGRYLEARFLRSVTTTSTHRSGAER